MELFDGSIRKGVARMRLNSTLSSTSAKVCKALLRERASLGGREGEHFAGILFTPSEYGNYHLPKYTAEICSRLWPNS